MDSQISSDLNDKKKIKILHIDDDKSFLALTKLYLEEEGQSQFQVDTMTSPQEVLRHLKVTTYDIILSDYQMPGLNGIQLLEKVRNQGIQTPFIMLTGQGNEDLAIEAFNLGADCYIEKEADLGGQIAELISAINSLLTHK